MRVRYVVAAVIAVAALVPLTAWIFRMSLAAAAAAAPIIVVSAGAIVGIVVLWTRVAYEDLRDHPHRRAIVLGGLGVLAVLVVLSFVVEVPSYR